MYYILDQTFFNLLTFSANIGPVSYLLYIGVYYYITRRYSNVFHITDLSQKYLSDAYVIYSSTVNKIQYDRLIGKLSLEKRMKFFFKEQISCQGQVYSFADSLVCVGSHVKCFM